MKNSLIELLDELKSEIIFEVISVIRNEFTKPSKKEFYSLKEVSEITGLPISSIKRKYRSGSIKRVYSGNRPLIPSQELEKLICNLNLQSANK
jgi:hypothetical protein